MGLAKAGLKSLPVPGIGLVLPEAEDETEIEDAGEALYAVERSFYALRNSGNNKAQVEAATQDLDDAVARYVLAQAE